METAQSSESRAYTSAGRTRPARDLGLPAIRATPRMGGALHWPSVCAPPLSLLTTALLGVLNFGWARFALVSIGLSDYGALKLAWPALTHWRCPVRGIGMVCYHSRKIEAVGKATLSITRMGEVSEHP